MVLVIDCTTTWAPPPMATPPTFICRLVTGRSCSAASVISLPRFAVALILFRDERLSSEDFTQVCVGREQEQGQHEHDTYGRDLAHRLLAHGPAEQLLGRYKEEVPAVERQDGQQVEDGEVQADQGEQRQKETLVDGRTAYRGDPHRPRHVVVKLLLARHELPYESPELGRDLHAP